MHDLNRFEERVVLITVLAKDLPDSESGESELDELALLAKTAEAEVVGKLVQKRGAPHPTYYMGKGKLDELKKLIELVKATGVISDDELSNTQQKNMERILGVKIMDRSMLILDIFAKHASTAEGKAQVESAQLRYRLSHLAGIGGQMSRLAGGIGTRGPGESKLETDRRHIRNRISSLDAELRDIAEHRHVIHEKRKRSRIPVISMVGYTNAGKSTLMNTLTSAGVLAENKLFATLDTTTRRMQLPGGFTFLFSDTVGFIQKLPHTLIKAFRATLMELEEADVLVHVVDVSNPNYSDQMEVVYDTLNMLNCMSKPIITVYNKIDLSSGTHPSDHRATATVELSAITGQNIPALTAELERTLQGLLSKTTALIPFDEGHLTSLIHQNCEILLEEYRENGTYIEFYGPMSITSRLEKYLVGKT